MGFSLSRKNKNFQTVSNMASLEAVYSVCASGMNSTSCQGEKSSSQRGESYRVLAILYWMVALDTQIRETKD